MDLYNIFFIFTICLVTPGIINNPGIATNNNIILTINNTIVAIADPRNPSSCPKGNFINIYNTTNIDNNNHLLYQIHW